MYQWLQIAEIGGISAQFLQTRAFTKTVAGFGSSFRGIDGLNTPFGVVQDRMESFSCMEGAC